MSEEELFIVQSTNFLNRRIPINPDFLRPDGKISSAVFKLGKKDRNTGVSIDINELVIDISASYNPTTHKLAQVSASVVIEVECRVIHDPVPLNVAHGFITNMTDGKAKKISDKAVILN